MTVKTNSYNLAIRADGDTRIIRSNGIPEHGVGEFPNRGKPQRDLTPRAMPTVSP